MITPHPESNLSLNIITLGSEILSLLNSKKYFECYVFVDLLMNDFLAKDENRTPIMFYDTLIFLYMFDILDFKEYKIRLKNIHRQTKLFE